MSLFKVREWWQTRCGTDEEFDGGCLCVSNVDGDTSGMAKIITGSFAGMLRIYFPRQNGFRPDDLLLEYKLDAPIIQIETGRFVEDASQMALAVLHPRKLSVYIVTRVGGNSQSPGFYSLSKQYDHIFERVAYNFVYGPFGSMTDKDHICIQSVDGQLSFFEQDRFIFSRFLSDFLLPGPLCYSPIMDCFITANSRMEIQSFKYHVLASSSGSRDKESVAASSNTGGKKIQAEWSLNIGEDVVSIAIARYGKYLTATQSEIIVLGERTMFCIKETGMILSQKRLDFFPSAMKAYSPSPDLRHQNLIIGTHNSTLVILRDPKVIWAAKTNSVPVAIRTATFDGLNGLIVLLDDEGNLSVNYLGTDPANNPVSVLESKELDYVEMDEEHRRLQLTIKQSLTASKIEVKPKLSLKAQLPFTIDKSTDNSAPRRITVKLFLLYDGEEPIENVTLTISAEAPIVPNNPTIVLPTIQGGGSRTPLIVPVTFTTSTDCDLLPTSIEAEVLASFFLSTGEPQTTKCTFLLPLAMVCSIVAPVKSSTHKITLSVNRNPPTFGQLFEDVLEISEVDRRGMASASVMTLQYTNGIDVTILISKNEGRKFRIQSSSFEALWLISNELIRRIASFVSAQSDLSEETNSGPFSVSFHDSLPFDEYFSVIDTHFQCRQKIRQLQEKLSNMAHQMRSIQKRLLLRFKDKNPAPLNNLDLLFEKTYQKLIQNAEEVEKAQANLVTASNRLSCATNLMLSLVKFNIHQSEKDAAVLREYLTPDVQDHGEQGWEEHVDAAMTHLLRTTLAKNSKESSVAIQPLEPLKDTTKLKKHIALVIDRLSKGATLHRSEKKEKSAKRPSSARPTAASAKSN